MDGGGPGLAVSQDGAADAEAARRGDLHVASLSGGPGAPLTSYGMHCCRPLKAVILAALQSPGKPGRRRSLSESPADRNTAASFHALGLLSPPSGPGKWMNDCLI